jgi:hypothetical protein
MVYLNLKLNGLPLMVYHFRWTCFIIQFISYDYSGNLIENEMIELSKLKLKSVESYECIADNGIGDVLRKVVTIYFSGKTFVKSSD